MPPFFIFRRAHPAHRSLTRSDSATMMDRRIKQGLAMPGSGAGDLEYER